MRSLQRSVKVTQNITALRHLYIPALMQHICHQIALGLGLARRPPYLSSMQLRKCRLRRGDTWGNVRVPLLDKLLGFGSSRDRWLSVPENHSPRAAVVALRRPQCRSSAAQRAVLWPTSRLRLPICHFRAPRRSRLANAMSEWPTTRATGGRATPSARPSQCSSWIRIYRLLCGRLSR